MDAMKTKLVLFLLCFSLAFANSALAKTILPDACGDDSVKFDVKTEKNQPAPAGPDAGKAQIVFINMVPYESALAKFPVIRYGVDGAWVGANKGDSYFTLTVDPGVRNVCVSAQGVLKGAAKDFIDQATLTAEAGKVYYFETNFGIIGGMGGGGVMTFGIAPLDEKAGKYRVKAWKLSTSKPNK
jgi:hypothetical protein